jgi:hypothetical protein
MNRANLLLLDSKAANRAIARDRNGNVNNASAKDKVDKRAVAANNVAANKVAAEANKADDKPGCLGSMSGGSCLPPLVMFGYLDNDSGSFSALLL